MDLSKFRKLVTKASLAHIALGVSLLYWLMELTVSVFLITGGAIPDEPVDLMADIESSYPVLLLVSAILFIVWSYAAHANLQRLGREGLRHHDQATIWWWITPIANLFMPYRVTYETIRGTTAPADNPDWMNHRLPAYAGWWTGLFIAGQLFVQASTTIILAATVDTDLRVGGWVLAIGSLSLIGAALTAMVLIAKVTRAQIEHAEAIAQSPTPAFAANLLSP